MIKLAIVTAEGGGLQESAALAHNTDFISNEQTLHFRHFNHFLVFMMSVSLPGISWTGGSFTADRMLVTLITALLVTGIHSRPRL